MCSVRRTKTDDFVRLSLRCLEKGNVWWVRSAAFLENLDQSLRSARRRFFELSTDSMASLCQREIFWMAKRIVLVSHIGNRAPDGSGSRGSRQGPPFLQADINSSYYELCELAARAEKGRPYWYSPSVPISLELPHSAFSQADGGLRYGPEGIKRSSSLKIPNVRVVLSIKVALVLTPPCSQRGGVSFSQLRRSRKAALR